MQVSFLVPATPVLSAPTPLTFTNRPSLSLSTFPTARLIWLLHWRLSDGIKDVKVWNWVEKHGRSQAESQENVQQATKKLLLPGTHKITL